MDYINFTKLIDERNASTSEIAKILFPDNTYPHKAFARVLKGQSELTASQISRLAFHFKVSINELFVMGQWKSNGVGSTIKLSKGDFEAELDMSKGTTKIWQNGTLFHDTVIHSKTIKLSEYISELNNLIK